MRSSATAVIASAALVLSGCAVGLLLGRWTSTPVAVERTLPEIQAQQQDLMPVLENIQRTCEALLQVVRERGAVPQPAPSSREAAVPHPEPLDRLATAVERLNELLHETGGHMGIRSTAVEKWKGPGFPSLYAVWQRVKAISEANGPDWSVKLTTELTRTHLVWTREDLFERYGSPTVLGASERGLDLTYEREVEPGKTESIVFQTADDLVTYVYYNN
jgi:hypothetical protein